MSPMLNELFFTLAQTPTGGAVAPPPAAEKSLLEYIQAGGAIGYVIILLSFVAVALIVVQLIRLRIGTLAPPEAVQRLDQMLRENDTEGAIAYCAEPGNDSLLTRMFGAALERCSKSPFGLLELRSALEEAGQEQVARLHRATDPIGLIAAVAPMLGLLGTVVGMVGAFDTIAGTQGFARPDQLAGYISLALITTVQGLIVAIPCTAMYTYLKNRIDHLAGDVGAIVEELSSHLHSNGDPAGPASERRPAARPAGTVAGGVGAR